MNKSRNNISLVFLFCIFIHAPGLALAHGNVVVIPMDSGFPTGVEGDLVTCNTVGVDSSSASNLNCVIGGGIDSSNSIQAIPQGKVLYVNHIAAIPSRLFAGPHISVEPNESGEGGYLHWFLRLSRDPATGPANIVYEIRGYNTSEHITFSSPIIRLEAGDRLFAQNLTTNSFTNDLRVFVSGWMIDD